MISTKLQEPVTTDFNLWNIDFGASWFLEFPKHELKKLLPSKLEVYESRPQIGLVCVTVFTFKEGHPHCKPATSELTLSVQVIPDHTLMKQPPRYALYVFRGAADTKEFLSHEYNTDKLPFEANPFLFEIDRNNSRVQIRDTLSQPVLDLRGPSTAGTFLMQENHYQYFNSKNGDLYAGSVKMENNLSIHQELNEDFGQLFSHPIFQGLDVSTMEDCFLHMVTKNGDAGVQHFYPAKRVNR